MRTDAVGKAYLTIRSLDDFAHRKGAIFSLHPAIKLSVTVIYIFAVASFGRYDIIGLLPMAIFPVFLLTASDLPYSFFAKRIVLVLPFILLVGAFNPIFDRVAVTVAGTELARGWLSFAAIFLKGLLTASAAILLVATTGMDNIAAALRSFKVPKIFVLQLLLTYRYISVLLLETGRISGAYQLRAPSEHGIRFSAWGSLAGQLLLRTFDRAQRVYDAMRLRGFNGEYKTAAPKKAAFSDFLYLAVWVLLFFLTRRFNLPIILGNLFS